MPPESSRAALNRLTLCFLDAATERDFRLRRAEASRGILRRFIVFLALLVALATTGIHRKLELARAAGLPLPPQLDLGREPLLLAAALALGLFLATLSRRFVPYLHTLTAVCMGGLVLLDSWHSRHLPLAYALNGTLLNLVVLYIASQLRFAVASALGVAASLAYLCCITARSAPLLATQPDLQLQMGVTLTLLGCANLLLMFITHQRELSARLAYHRARLLEERGAELEAALTSLKQAEAQLVENEKQATVGRLVAGILHEMNTPLGALSSATQTLERGLQRLRSGMTAGSRPEALLGTLAAAERLASVQAQSGQRIRDVVESLRQFVSLDRAALQVADVRGGIETAAALIRPSLPRGVGLRLELPECPIWVQCFPAKLNQVFLNLLKNSAAAFDRGAADAPAEIVVSTWVLSGKVWLEVRDTGSGIEPERLERIFDVDFSRQGPRVKLSLGLPASRGVLEAIGGSLRIRSEVGRGTCVLIELPLGPAPLGARLALAARAPEGAATLEARPVAAIGASVAPSL